MPVVKSLRSKEEARGLTIGALRFRVSVLWEDKLVSLVKGILQ